MVWGANDILRLRKMSFIPLSGVLEFWPGRTNQCPLRSLISLVALLHSRSWGAYHLSRFSFFWYSVAERRGCGLDRYGGLYKEGGGDFHRYP